MNILDRAHSQQVEDNRYRKHEFLEHIIESLTYPFYVVDPSNYRVTLANSAAQESGLLQEATCHVLLHNNAAPCSGAENPCPIAIVKNTKQPTKVEHLHRDQKGNPRYTEIHAYPILDPAGNVTQIIEYAFDITEQKKTEEALRESEAKWRSLTEYAPDYIMLLDRETKILFINRTVSDLTKEQVIGTSVYDYVVEEYAEIARECFERVLNERTSATFESAYKDSDGNVHMFESCVGPVIRDDQVVALTVRSTDVTKRKQAEQAVKESEARFKKLLDEDLDGIILADLETGIIFDCNNAIAKMVGREKSELIGQSQKILYPSESDSEFTSTFTQQLPHKDDYIFEAQIITKQSQIKDVEIKSTIADLQGKRIMMALFRDITRRKRIREKIQWLARFPSENPHPVLRVDQHGIILYANTASTALLKYWGCQIHRQLPDPWKVFTEKVIHTGRSRTTEATCFQRTLSLTFAPVVDQEYVNIYGLDITKRKQAEEELKKYRHHLEELVQERTTELTKVNEHLQQEIMEHKRAEQALLKSEEQYRMLAEHVADGIGIAQDGKFVFVNQALCSILEYIPDQLLRVHLIDLFRDDYKDKIRDILEQLQQGILVEQLQAPCITGDGREIWAEGYHSFIEWEGKPAILVTVRDITKQKLRELEIEEARERLQKENIVLRTTFKDRYKFGEIIGKSPVMQEIYELIAQSATTDVNVLITGESGTGKELIARTIHHLSDRCEQAFVPVNCGAIPEALFESEFFGHRKGAFTGADRDKTGFFDVAHKGTLFLDEVGELFPNMQVKLLRALEIGEYTPVGMHTPRQADVRIIAATNRNLNELRQQGLIREDFFYRINVVMITIPPLRKRKKDVPLLIDHFLEQYDPDKTRTDLPGKILKALYQYDWPGNIRELQNVLQRYLTVGQLHFTDTDNVGLVEQQDMIDAEEVQDNLRYYETLEVLEKQMIIRALEQHHWHRSNAAAALGIPRRTLHRKMKKFGLM